MWLYWFQLWHKARFLRAQGVDVTVRGRLLVVQGGRPPRPFFLRPPRPRRSSRRRMPISRSPTPPTVVSFPRVTLPALSSPGTSDVSTAQRLSSFLFQQPSPSVAKFIQMKETNFH